VLCGSVERHGRGEYMAEVRTSSHSERPCAVIEETRDAAGDAGGGEQSRRRKVHSLIDKVYAPANLAEAWKRVRENKGGAGIDGLTVTAFEDREAEHLAGLHARLRDQTYRPAPVKRVGIPKAGGGTRNLGIPTRAA
jgi:RNA-directed DNA polymerase